MYAEIHAIIARREREKFLSANEAHELHDRFDVDWTFELTPVELAVGVLGLCERLSRLTPYVVQKPSSWLQRSGFETQRG
jgi:hypothetical protein